MGIKLLVGACFSWHSTANLAARPNKMTAVSLPSRLGWAGGYWHLEHVSYNIHIDLTFNQDAPGWGGRDIVPPLGVTPRWVPSVVCGTRGIAWAPGVTPWVHHMMTRMIADVSMKCIFDSRCIHE